MNPKNFPERKNIKRKLAWNMLIERFGEEIADNSFKENVDCTIKVLITPQNIEYFTERGYRIAAEIKSLKHSISEESLREKRTKIFRGQNN